MSMPVLSRGGSHCCPLVVHRRVLSLLPHFLLEIIATVFFLAVAGSPSHVHYLVVVFVRCCRRRCCLSSCPLPSVALRPRDHRHSFLLGGGRIVRLPFTFCLAWLFVASHLVAPPPPLPLVFTTRCFLPVSSRSANSASRRLEAPPAFETSSPLVCWRLPSCLPLVPRLVVATPPPLVLLTRRLRLSTRNLCILTSRRLLSTGASPPFCIGFAYWLSRRLSPCRLCFASPIFALPPHVSFLYPPPVFASAGCCVAS